MSKDIPKDIILNCFIFIDNPYDLLTTQLVSKTWCECSRNNHLWEKFCKKWRRWPDDESHILNQTNDYKKRWIIRNYYERRIYELLEEMVLIETRNSVEDEIEKIGRAIVMEYLYYFIKNCQPNKNLHRLRSANYLFQQMNLENLANNLLAMIKEKPNRIENVLEKGAIYIAQWHYPSLEYEDVVSQLDAMGNELKQHLSQFNNLSTMNLIEQVNFYFFTIKKFKGNSENYYNPQNSFINDVLETKLGIPITLSIVYSAVCNRVGIQIDLIGMPMHLIVRYLPPNGEEPLFIDPFNSGRILTQQDCLLNLFSMTGIADRSFLEPIPPVKVWLRMTRNMIELRTQDFSCLTKLGPIFLGQPMTSNQSVNSISKLYKTFQKMVNNAKWREEAKFDVGHVVRTNRGTVGVVLLKKEGENSYGLLEGNLIMERMENELVRILDPVSFARLGEFFMEFDEIERKYIPIDIKSLQKRG